MKFSLLLDVPIELVWENFIYKIEHPADFVPGVSHVEILERHSAYTSRLMNLTDATGTITQIVEKITAAPFKVRYELVEHPIFTGWVDNIAEQISEQQTKITFEMHWRNKHTNELFQNQSMIENAVKKTATFIEKAI